MKVYLKIRALQPVDFYSEGTGYQAGYGDVIPVNSRFMRHPNGIGGDAAVSLVKGDAAALIEWAEITDAGELGEVQS